MNERDFFYWLQGFFEISGKERLNRKQVQIIKDHMKLVVDKQTPEYYSPWTVTNTSPLDVNLSNATPNSLNRPLICGNVPNEEPICGKCTGLDCTANCICASPKKAKASPSPIYPYNSLEFCMKGEGACQCEGTCSPFCIECNRLHRHVCMRLADPANCTCTTTECKADCESCLQENIKQLMNVPTVLSC